MNETTRLSDELEAEHAIDLLCELNWVNLVQVRSDPTCRFGAALGRPCGEPIHSLTILRLPEGDRLAHLVTCERHSEVLRKASELLIEAAIRQNDTDA